ncbi:hypothetical protein NC651_016026 [Populus alba x Populus x berolinensis]|nr:hypothetical protein NC651_016026 [Populus alba x Populus x berolinensis]
MVIYEQESDVIQWGLRLLDGDPPFYSGYYGEAIVQSDDGYHGHYVRDHYDITDCSHVENDEMIARTLQEEFSQLAVTEENVYSHGGEEHLQTSVDEHDWHCTPMRNYCSDNECSHEESDDAVPSSSCSSPANGEEYSPEFNDEYGLDDEVGKRLNQLIPIRHVPRINGEIPSIDEATTDHERLLNRYCVQILLLQIKQNSFPILFDWELVQLMRFIDVITITLLIFFPYFFSFYLGIRFMLLNYCSH